MLLVDDKDYDDRDNGEDKDDEVKPCENIEKYVMFLIDDKDD